MAFPYTYEEEFETGGIGQFDSETDANGVLNIRPWHRLAIDRKPVPYSGAFACEIDLAGADTTQYLQETGSLDLAAAGTLYLRLEFYISGLVMAASDRFTIFALQSGAGTDEAVIDIRNNAGTIEILAAETGAAATIRAGDLIQGVWHTAELYVLIDSGAPGDGTIDFWLDGNQIGAQITALDQAVITQARLGAMGVDAGTTAGKIYFNSLAADDGRLFPRKRFPNPRTFTRSGQFFVGPGWVNEVAHLKTSNSDEKVYLFDIDDATVWATDGTPDQLEQAKVLLDSTHTVASTNEYFFQKGCYVHLAGTNPFVRVAHAQDDDVPGVHGAYHYDEAGMARRALSR